MGSNFRGSPIFLLWLSYSLIGCAPALWDKEGGSEQEFRKDSYECERDARQRGYFGGGIIGAVNFHSFYERCLFARGYQKALKEEANSLPHFDKPSMTAFVVIQRGKIPENYKEIIEEKLIETLKDSDFHKVEFLRTPHGSLVCGTVNTRNSYREYSGKNFFTAFFDEMRKFVRLNIYSQKEVDTIKTIGSPYNSSYLDLRILQYCDFIGSKL